MRQFQSHSQAGQDAFAYHVLGRPRIGSFLDIGCSHPVNINNTYALEQMGLLYGLSIDCGDHAEAYRQLRRTPFLRADATKLDWEAILVAAGMPTLIDYLSLDIDEWSVEVLRKFPLGKYRFRVITAEHDAYRVGGANRAETRQILLDHGYSLICGDVTHKGLVFEDWWVDPARVFEPILKPLACNGREGLEIAAICKEPRRLNDYFDRIFCINTRSRWDRWSLALEECARHHFTVERFPGHDLRNDGNRGCTASHRAILELAAFHGWNRVLVLEDDFHIRHADFMERFEHAWSQVPQNWDMVYLGGHYEENPQARVAQNVIKINRMKTTSSYAITGQFARWIAPYIEGAIPIDNLFSNHLPENECFILSPRLIVQRESFSDLQNRVCNNAACMEDTHHENTV